MSQNPDFYSVPFTATSLISRTLSAFDKSPLSVSLSAFHTPLPPRNIARTSVRPKTAPQNIDSASTSHDAAPKPVYAGKKYKKVANRTYPVRGTLPEEFRIVRRPHPNPLTDIPILPPVPPPFEPGKRYTQKRHDAYNANKYGFLTSDEEKLVHHVIRAQEDALAWEETEKGRFKDEYFDPILFPTLEHVPWVIRNLPIPPGLYDKVVDIIRSKISAGVYEDSNSSYRSRWFCVPKKDGTSLRLVHDLQPLNKITIQDVSVAPITDTYAESFAARSCYGLLDLFVSFDQRTLDERCRDMTTFQTPLGAKRLTSVPMGYTNAPAIMHGDVTFILKDEIPDVTTPFIDDVPVKGPKTRYELPNGAYEAIPENPNVRRFVWEHLNNFNRVLQRMKKAGGTFNGKKLTVCAPTAVIVGHLCTYEGRIPDDSHVQRIRDWPPCEELRDVRSFLGTCGLVRIFIRGYALMSRPLVELTKKDVPFEFGPRQQAAMDTMKEAVLTSPALRPIDYDSGSQVILAVDSSSLAAGFILMQVGNDAKRYPARFGSIYWNDRESRYSQAKIELYGLFRALRAYRVWLVGLPVFTVEVDAKYIKGMLNNPDVQPNAAVNRWIAAILLFDFELVHVPAEKHTGADGLSRRRPAEHEGPDKDDPESWIDDACGFAIELVNWHRQSAFSRDDSRHEASVYLADSFASGSTEDADDPNPLDFPQQEKSEKKDHEMEMVKRFLETVSRPEGIADEPFRRLVRLASRFFLLNHRLWRRRPDGRHQLYIPPGRRLPILKEAHDDLGHKGAWIVLSRLQERVWWPSINRDTRWFVKSCHQCQIRQVRKVLVPPTIAIPVTLFRKAYMDTMRMPRAQGYSYLVQARCSLSAYPEWRPVRSESGKAIAAFIFEEILCRWGALAEIVTDNGTPFVAALEVLREKYHVHHIRISPYNSRANGIVERQHFPVREAAIKAADGNENHWPNVHHSVLWAERVSIQRSTGYSPYRIAHGIDPVFPFDLAEATYLAPPLDAPITTADLLSIRARQLQKREEDLQTVRDRVLEARYDSVRAWIKEHEKTIIDFDFAPGSLVLVRNSKIELELNRKHKPRYFGPMVVVRRTRKGAYVLCELDGSVAKTPYAAFRLLPYVPRSRASLPIFEIVEKDMDDENLDVEELPAHDDTESDAENRPEAGT